MSGVGLLGLSLTNNRTVLVSKIIKAGGVNEEDYSNKKEKSIREASSRSPAP